MSAAPVYDAERRHESPDVGAAAARMIRGLVQRAANKDTEALEQLAALEQLIPAAVTMAGYRLHQGGYSHAELGAVLGVSRQASVKRFAAAPMLDMQRGAVRFLTRATSAAAYMSQTVAQLAARRSI